MVKRSNDDVQPETLGNLMAMIMVTGMIRLLGEPSELDGIKGILLIEAPACEDRS